MGSRPRSIPGFLSSLNTEEKYLLGSAGCFMRLAEAMSN